MLIELCSSLAAASMVMLLGVTLIERSMHWTQSVQRHTNLQRELGQLASAWRDDCGRASQIEFQSADRVVFSMSGQEVIYQIDDHRIQRLCDRKDPLASKASAPEDYLLGTGYRAVFESPYLIVQTTDPVGRVIATRLRILGKTTEKTYRILEDQP
jgi:hypothetical protein